MTKILLILMLGLVGACSFDPAGGPGEADDETSADGGHDAAPTKADAHGADAGGARGSACTPTHAQCAAGLTCRHHDGNEGRCEPSGTQGPGAACADDEACGADMICLADGGASRCFVLCERPDTIAACSEAQVCDAYWGAEWRIGICTPG